MCASTLPRRPEDSDLINGIIHLWIYNIMASLRKGHGNVHLVSWLFPVSFLLLDCQWSASDTGSRHNKVLPHLKHKVLSPGGLGLIPPRKKKVGVKQIFPPSHSFSLVFVKGEKKSLAHTVPLTLRFSTWPYGGLYVRYPKYQVFILWFITTAKLQFWSSK